MNLSYDDCNSKLEYALFYAQKLNWHVFPVHYLDNDKCSCNNPNCTSPCKHPIPKNGLKSATTNIDIITEWWKKYPKANIAVRTGQISDLIVLDIDSKSMGFESLEQMEDEIGSLESCVESDTGGGGQHKFYKCGNLKLRNRTGVLNGIDVRAEDGYVIIPPSTHVSGKVYEWDCINHPEDNKPELPRKELLELLDKQANKPLESNDEKIAEGQRNSTLARLAGKLHQKQYSISEIEVLLKDKNLNCCVPPLDEKEVLNIVNSITSYKNSLNWETPHLPIQDELMDRAYPIELFPESISKLALEIARFSKVDVTSPVMVALGTLAVSIGKKAKVIEKEGLEHYPSFFLVAVAGSGERKSDSFKNVIKPLKNWEKEKLKEYEEERSYIEARNATANEYIQDLKKKIRKIPRTNKFKRDQAIKEIQEEKAAILALPSIPRLFTSDITPQNLFQKMHERGGVFAVMSGEGRDVVDNIMGKYNSSKKADDTIYLAGISGDSITRDRVGNESEESKVIHDPCLNVCIFIQPDKYNDMTSCKQLRDSGAIARILSIKIPSKVGTRLEQKNEIGLQDNELQSFYYLINKLLNFTRSNDENNETIPHKAKLSSEAQEARRLLFNQIELKQTEDGDYNDVKDIASKSISTFCKIALILHIAEDPNCLNKETSEISLNTWKNAEEIGLFHLEETIRSVRQGKNHHELAEALKLVKWLINKSIYRFKVSEIVNHCPNKLRDTNKLKSVCHKLITEGWLQKRDGNNSRNAEYELHPEADKFLKSGESK